MSVSLWCAYFALIAASALVQSITGFGFSILSMIFLPYLFTAYSQAVAVSSLLSLFTATAVAYRLRAATRWRILAPCVIGYLLTAPIAIRLSVTLEKALLTRLLGCMLVLLSLWFIFAGSRLRIRPTKRSGVIVGMLSGLSGGLFSIGGPPIVIYYLSALNDKNEYMATTEMTLTVTCIYAAVIRLINGIFTAALIGRIAVGAAAVGVGALIGSFILRRMSLEWIRKLVYAVMIVSGVKMALGF